MLDKIMERMEMDPERRFAGRYFEGRVADLRVKQDDLHFGICGGYLSCLRSMGFITDGEEIEALSEIGDIYTGRERECERI